MTGFLGYFMGGMASGLQSGMNMGMQIQELKWKKEARESAKKIKNNLETAVMKFNNRNEPYFESIGVGKKGYDLGASPQGNIGADTTNYNTPSISTPTNIGATAMGNLPNIGSQGILTNPDVINLLAAFSAVSDSLATAFSDMMIAANRGDVTEYEQKMEYINNMIDHIATINLAGGDVNSYWGVPNLVSEESRRYFRAAETMKNTPASKITPGMVGDTSALTGSFSQETIEGIRTQPATEAPSMADEKSAIDLLRVFLNASPEQFEKQRTKIEQERGLDLSNYTQDILKAEGSEFFTLYDTPEEVLSKVKAPAGSGLMVVPSRDSKTGKYYATFQKETATTPGGTKMRATSLDTLEKYREKALDATTWGDAESIIDDYKEAGYDPAPLEEKVDEQEWINAKLEELDNHVEMLKEITDEKGKLLGDKKVPFLSDGEEETQTGEEWYKDIYEAYTFYLAELKKMGVDVSKYPKIRSLEEYNKSDTKLGKGLFYPSTWGKQKSIYY